MINSPQAKHTHNCSQQ